MMKDTKTIAGYKLANYKKAKRFLGKHKKRFTLEDYMESLNIAGIEATEGFIRAWYEISDKEEVRQICLREMDKNIDAFEKLLREL